MTNKKKKAFVRRAVKDRGFLYPDFKNPVRRFLILAASFYLRLAEGISKVFYINENIIIDAMNRFAAGEEKLIFVFRHAAKEDPPVLVYSFLKALRKKIQKNGALSHLCILYGRDVPNWAGPITEWLFPKIGAIPVQAHNGNKDALTLIRKEMTVGQFPIALAPEEQVVYHMYKCFNIAPGISSIVKWGLESGKPVRVVPLAMGYNYGADPESFIRERLAEWENLTGIALEGRESGDLHPLLCCAAEGTLSLIEPLCGIKNPEPIENQPPAQIDKRIQRLCQKLLTEAERQAGISSEGTISDRLFRLRYRGYDALFTKDDPSKLPPLSRAAADFSALKAEVYIRFERIIDVLEYIHMDYINPPFSSGRGCEFILNLLDVINRTMGGNISEHSTPQGQHAVVMAGSPLIYRPSSLEGSGRREFIEGVKDDIKKSLESLSAELEETWEKIKLH